VDPIQALIQFLEGLSQDPVAYSIVFYLYSVAATVFLPIPVEVGLFFSPETSIVIKALVLGAGKATGSVLVFKLGGKLENVFDSAAFRHRYFQKILELMRRFVARTRYVGLYIILSIPLMVDTVPIYVFAFFNKKGVMDMRHFAITNFFAGITRAAIVYGIALAFNIRLI
jgi:hypothetical protein